MRCNVKIMRVLSVLFLLAITYSVFASTKRMMVQKTGIFSNMCINKESRDLTGMEMFVVYSFVNEITKGYYVILQYCEGAVYPPVVIKAKIDDNAIEFEVLKEHNQLLSGKFRGIIQEDGIRGGFSGHRKSDYLGSIFLKRQLSYWQEQRLCK